MGWWWDECGILNLSKIKVHGEVLNDPVVISWQDSTVKFWKTAVRIVTSLLKFVRQEFVGGGKIIFWGNFCTEKQGKYAGNIRSVVNKKPKVLL